MKKTLLSSVLAFGLVASTAVAEGNAPVMQMDEQMIVKEMAHEGGAFNAALPMILMIALAILAGAATAAPAPPLTTA